MAAAMSPGAEATEALARKLEMLGRSAGDRREPLGRHLDAVALFTHPATDCLDQPRLRLAEMATEAAIEAVEWCLEDLRELAAGLPELDRLARENGYQGVEA
jgi:hypothetical protein